MKFIFESFNNPEKEFVDFDAMGKLATCDNLVQKSAEIVEGVNNIWYEYIPKSYDGTKSVPLVVQVHGGGHDGKRWVDYTIWHKLAEQLGFIVIYPNSIEYQMWTCTDTDIEYLYDLIKLIQSRYNIDKNRIYMQGMSNGDMMTLAFSMKHPEMLAAAGFLTGPAPEEAIDGERPVGALPLIQFRGEKDVNWNLNPDTEDVYSVRYEMNDLNREIWLEANGITGLPALSIVGRQNFLRFKGSNAPIINWEIKDMGHREPAESAQIIWDYLYSGCSRLEDGSLKLENPIKNIEGDNDLVVLCAGGDKIYKKDKVVSIGSLSEGCAKIFHPSDPDTFFDKPLNEMYQTPDLFAPAEFFNAAFGAEVEYIDSGDQVVITFNDGMKVEMFSKSPLIIVDGEYRALKKPSVLLCGAFYIPIGIFCEEILNKHVSMADDTMCISGHFAQIGRYTARIIKNYIK